jgi:cysteinyl-tRNA synthetase
MHKTEEVESGDLIAALYRLEKNILKIWLFDVVEEEEVQIPEEVIKLAEQRLQAKKDKDYVLSDSLRDDIAKAWFEIKDTPEWYEITKL